MNSRDITLWLDERWYNALSCQLKKKDTTVEDELNEYLDAMIDQLPEQVSKKISREIWEEDQQARAEAEANRPAPFLYSALPKTAGRIIC